MGELGPVWPLIHRVQGRDEREGIEGRQQHPASWSRRNLPVVSLPDSSRWSGLFPRPCHIPPKIFYGPPHPEQAR